MKIEISKIVRSRRKTIALEIRGDASLIIRAPFFVSQEVIEKLVEKKKSWIYRKQRLVKERCLAQTKKEFVNGEEFLYLGKAYRLDIVERIEPPLVLENSFLLSRNYLKDAKQIFADWYRKQAIDRIEERAGVYADIGGLKYETIRITRAQSRWGSCGKKGNLNFSWRLIMAPPTVIDYVIVHELSHLRERNHSKRFWEKVAILCPNYKNYRKWLNTNGHLLSI